MQLGSNIGQKGSFHAMFVRDLGEADLPQVLNPQRGLTVLPTPMQMRHRHHSAARLMAEGRPTHEIMAITGYSNARLSTFKTMPDFQELVSGYKAAKDALYLDAHGRKAELHVAVIDELQDRLEEEPKKFTNRELAELLKASDSQGEAPKAPAGIAVNINFVAPKSDHLETKTSPITIDGELA